MKGNLPLPSTRVTVVGGGLAGLATALRLRHAGAEVTLLEKNDTVGGKLAEFRKGGFRWDMGPSLLTMPDVLDDLFLDIGLKRSDFLELQRIDPVCRYFWPDGHQVDEDEAFFEQKDVAAFMEYAKGIYELSGEAFLTRPPGEIWKAFAPRNWLKLRHLPKITTFKTLSQKVDFFFQDPHLAQLFKRFATYNGSSPYRAPATFNVIPYVESKFGAWYIKGGMAKLGQVLGQLARERGVKIQTQAEVVRCDETGAILRDGTIIRSDLVVVNGDVIRAWKDWLRYAGHKTKTKNLMAKDRALSGFILFLGVSKRFSQLSHHNIFFSHNYEEEFRDLFERHRFPADPTVYISITSRTESADAPEGCDNYFVLVNAPAEVDKIDWEGSQHVYADRVITKLEAMGLQGLRENIRHQRVFTPSDFGKRDLSFHGSLYGWASHSPMTALLRPPLASREHGNLFFTGGTTHPGGGIPLVLLSAKMVSEKIVSKFGK